MKRTKSMAAVLCAALITSILAGCGQPERREPEKIKVTMVYSEKLEHI